MLFRFLNSRNGKTGLLNRLQRPISFFLRMNFNRRALELLQASLEHWRILPLQVCGNGPIFDSFKRIALRFPFTDDPYGHGLHSTGTQPTPNFLPEQGAQHISDNTIQHPARLLRIHLIHVDGAGRFQRSLDRALGDFVKEDSVHLVGLAIQFFGNVPSNGFTFSIGVWCQEHFICLLRLSLDLGESFTFSSDDDIVRFEVVFDINPQLALG